jgi:NADPH:quinone reductase-like Zn-dependent oxidoreductase
MTRNHDRFVMLEKLGAERCEVERRDLSKHIPEAKEIDAVLDLVGNTVMLDSLAMLRRGGRSCLARWESVEKRSKCGRSKPEQASNIQQQRHPTTTRRLR